jgi:hypothetical protein
MIDAPGADDAAHRAGDEADRENERIGQGRVRRIMRFCGVAP